MAEESVLATPELKTANHAHLKAGAPIVVSHDAVTGRCVVMCNTMPEITDTTFVCAQCGFKTTCIGTIGYHSQAGRCYYAHKQAVINKYNKSKNPDATSPVVPPFYTQVVTERLPTFPVTIKNFKTTPVGETKLFDEAFPDGKPVFEWYKNSVEGKKLDNPEPLFTLFEKYYFLFPAVGSGRNLKTNLAKTKSALAESKSAHEETKAELAALKAAQMKPSAVVEKPAKPAVKVPVVKAKKSKKAKNNPPKKVAVQKRTSTRARTPTKKM